MNQTMLLTFEACVECNLADIHPQCPNRHPERWSSVDTSTPLSDEKIVEIAVEAYTKLGFHGMIAWHYYNEPLVARNRIIKLSKEIRRIVPESRFLLWTNGELIQSDDTELGIFETINISNYFGKDFGFVNKLAPYSYVCDFDAKLDGRLNIQGEESDNPCFKMFNEIIFDFYGNVRICCMDWKGNVRIGNINTYPLEILVERFNEVRNQIVPVMKPTAPLTCRRCNMRQGMMVELVRGWLGFQ